MKLHRQDLKKTKKKTIFNKYLMTEKEKHNYVKCI